MPVLLRPSRDLPTTVERWAAITGTPSAGLDPAKRLPDLGAALEVAFAAISDDWLAMGRALSAEASSHLAHAPSCATNVSDMGLMMAWSRLVTDWAGQKETTLVVCDDPWVFRHLANLDGVDAGSAPGLLAKTAGLWIRGYAARTKAALTLCVTSLALRFHRRRIKTDAATLLVYGHPGSSAAGVDGYFGDLMEKLPSLQRVLHVDCPRTRALQLAQDGRSFSLHGFGNPGRALLLPFDKWRPTINGNYQWLVRRAAALEGGTGQGALLAWQDHCQASWLICARPKVVAWPWENHSWERAFHRRAKALGIMTIGYQHSVVGRQMLNYGPGSNGDGVAGLPDQILTSGQATLDRLITMGVPRQNLHIGGALRFTATAKVTHDPHGPVFVALPFDGAVASQMIAACRGLTDRDFLIKDHPMSPFIFEPSERLRRTDKNLADQEGLAGVLFAATTVGQEAALAGLPTWRFRPEDRIAMDILPDELDVPAVSNLTLREALDNPVKPGIVAPETFFAPVAMDLWRELLTLHD